ncbi:unnamed protein product [Owenia fusiformis]|uniref:Uncharacterized protein n=1 Tax=Owenia fusiformis TaxID=6347 RepID=A0A8J1TVX4_OWEFU|nr:unnamed protein product [Owenia fusiformis]
MDDQSPVVLSCNVTGISDPVVTWYRFGIKLMDEENKYEIDMNNNTLTILNPKRDSSPTVQNDVGPYECSYATDNKTLYVYSKPIIDNHHLGKSKNLIQGEVLVVNCPITGYPLPTVEWLKGGKPMDFNSSRIHFNIVDEIEGAQMTINDIKDDDRAEYTCVGTNIINGEKYNDTAVIMIRVIDKLAALWPFLGIVAEVVVLCTIIFIYEKRRSKQNNFEDEDSDPINDVKTNDSAAREGDVRQRKNEK